MKALLELHILQNFAPSNLNRDDTGSPKDTLFGGHRRGRISSQCLKRAVREYVRGNGAMLPESALAVRTKRVSQELVGALTARGRNEEEAKSKVTVALGGMGLKIDDGKSQYLLFLARSEIERLANLIEEQWDAISLAEEAGEKKTGRAAKQAAKDAAAEIGKAMKDLLDGGKAVDLALFGRMLADLPEKNRDAACQVAHAMSTHAIEREFDFYTAVDDLKPEDTAGADMLGTVEFTSACFYRYAAVDLGKLVDNLAGDIDLAVAGVEAFLRASIRAKPTGKQNSFAAHNDPGYVVLAVRKDADPRSLANAFEKPVRANRDVSLTGVSVEQLERTWEQLEAAYGQAGSALTLNLTETASHVGEQVATADDLVSQAMQQVRAALEA